MTALSGLYDFDGMLGILQQCRARRSVAPVVELGRSSPAGSLSFDQRFDLMRDVADEAVGVVAARAFGVDVERRVGSVGQDEEPTPVLLDAHAVEQLDLVALVAIDDRAHNDAFAFPGAADRTVPEKPVRQQVVESWRFAALDGEHLHELDDRVEGVESRLKFGKDRFLADPLP